MEGVPVEAKPEVVREDRPQDSPAKRPVAASPAERTELGSLTCRLVESEVRRRLDALPGQSRFWSGDRS